MLVKSTRGAGLIGDEALDFLAVLSLPFKLVDSKKISYMWGMKKGNATMNYEKLSRAMRQVF